MKPITLRLDPSNRARIHRLAARHGVKASDLIRNALAEKVPHWERFGVKLAIIGSGVPS